MSEDYLTGAAALLKRAHEMLVQGTEEQVRAVRTRRKKMMFEVAALYLLALNEQETAVGGMHIADMILDVFARGGIIPDAGYKKLRTSREEIYFDIGARFLEEMAQARDKLEMFQCYHYAEKMFRRGCVDFDDVCQKLGRPRQEIEAAIALMPDTLPPKSPLDELTP